MSRLFRSIIILAAVMIVTAFCMIRPAPGETPAQLEEKAQGHYNNGNYKLALDLYEKLLFEYSTDGLTVGNYLDRAVTCLQSLNRHRETDVLREKAVQTHPRNWRLLWRAAESWFNANHYGYIVAGEFSRGHHRGGGRYVNSFERDRVRALQLMEQARGLTDGEPVAGAVAEFQMRFAAMIMGYRGYGGAWRLQYLTDITGLPDYEEGYGYPYGGDQRYAPVGADGEPVYHDVPSSWEEAVSDGERWRWLLSQAGAVDDYRSDLVKYQLADFSFQQFGVQTMSSYGRWHSRAAEENERDESGTYTLHTLGDGETIARLATGVRRFNLPDEFNFIKAYNDLERNGRSYGEASLNRLAQIYENRRQYDRAAMIWRRSLEKYGGGGGWKEQRLEQIIGSWGIFEPLQAQSAGRGATLEFRYRNGERVSFEAQRIRVDALLKDAKGYLRSNPRQFDNDRLNIARIGHRLMMKNQKKYLAGQAAAWELALKPRPKHFDRRITVTTPLQDAGAYFLTARMAGGNVSRIVVWVSDTTIVRKRIDKGTLFYVADSETGEPLSGLKVDFFGYRRQATDWQKVVGRRYNTYTKEFSYRTDGSGLVMPKSEDFSGDHTWLVTASDDEGRLAYLGWAGVWYGARYDREYNAMKVYPITDRPVYRPGQNVRFKAWVRHAKYDQEDVSTYGNSSFYARIYSPRNEKVFEKNIRSDEWGGLHGEMALPDDAMLGVYRMEVAGQNAGQFRVEEYKKPEFEVVVQGPERPVMLGEEFTLSVGADYYFGAPVKNATVSYKVLRSAHTARWYPRGPWDWFYGPGYWWFAPDYAWYPGWHLWGLERPRGWWWPSSQTPPEVVASGEVPIGEDGRIEVKIDTAFVKEVHGDTDHRYEVVAEVTDSSRRTIVGTGEILVARNPFRVFAWVDRGYYRVGDVVGARFRAQTISGDPVKGKGILELRAISYAGGEPHEKLVRSWNLDTGDEGTARLQLQASAAGQYRLSYRVTGEGGRTMEGGYLFTVTGSGYDGRDFRFNALELIADRPDYAAGDTVRLMVNADRSDSTVLLFTRPANGVYLPPKVVRLDGKSTVEAIEVTRKDMPNFFVEALTVSGGRVYTEMREVIVPPEKRVMNVEVLPSSDRYRPGEKATVQVRLTDHAGRPVIGALAASVYDKAVEYVSGGSNVPEIRAFFWKWRRQHRPLTESTLDRFFGNLAEGGTQTMQSLGVFGGLVADELADVSFAKAREGESRMEVKMKKSEMAVGAAAPAAAPMEEPARVVTETDDFAGRDEAGGMGGERANRPEAAVTVRSEFADTAFWEPSLVSGEDGVAQVSFTMPENLSTWKMRFWAMGHGTVVGEGAAEAVTSKDLIIRLQSPRFFVEKDEVVLSANIHNYLEEEAGVRAVLHIEGGTLEPLGPGEELVKIEAGGEVRVDWRVRVVKEGEAVIRMLALSAKESDAVEMNFPVYVHGMLKTDSYSGVVRPEAQEARIDIDVPLERRIEQTRLELRYSPSLAGAMVDALPYLADYPYGCTEQTLNRFIPAVITRKVLLDMGLDLKSIAAKRTNLNAQEIGDDRERAAGWKRWKRNPVFDEEELDDMITAGLRRLATMQLSDGGWGWFSGWGERSYPHTTATVVHGLQVAAASGVTLPAGMLERGVAWLASHRERELQKLRNFEPRRNPYKRYADNLDALVHMVLVDAGRSDDGMEDFLYRDRTELAVYGKALLGMSLKAVERLERLAMVMTNIEQYLVTDDENQTAWLNMKGPWWYWYGSEFEAHAYYLKLLAATDPKGEKAAGIVKYLLNNRKHATYWNSTRDTALSIEALADYLRASGEDRPDMTVAIYLDGVKKKEAVITAGNLFSFDNTFVLEGRALSAGEHRIEVRRRGKGPVYFNAYLTNFTLEDHIEKAGLEVKVQRRYYLLEKVDKSIKVSGSSGQVLDQKVEKYKRVPLENLSSVTSGDLVEIELEIDSKNDYEYLVFEDMKAAGFEPVDVRSGYGDNDMGAYMELRDERVVFFVRRLARGRHSIAYRMRAEIPGRFSALPTRIEAMYAPELKANSDEIKINILDREEKQ